MKTAQEIIETVCHVQDASAARLIYENVFQRDGSYRDWYTASYQAPETHEGFAQKVCFDVAAQIREQTGKSTNVVSAAETTKAGEVK